MKTDKEIKETILNTLKDALESINAESSVKKVVKLDKKKETITVEFSYYSVPEDNYVGLACY